jgi:hypothetical protein
MEKLKELDGLGDAIVVGGNVVVISGVAFCLAVEVAVAVAVEVGELVAEGPLNASSRLTMTVAPPGTSKCHPSSHGGTTPSQLPVVLKVDAVIGVGVFGSRPI